MVRYLTTNGNSTTYSRLKAFALMYRRANGTFYEAVNIDDLVKSPKTLFLVIPAKAGIQSFQALLDSRLRGSDSLEDFLRSRQYSVRRNGKAMMTKEEYIESLRRRPKRVFVLGEAVENFVDHPMIRPSINACAMTYELSHLAEHEELLTAPSSLTGRKI